MNPEKDRLVHRLINTWDGDLGELIALVELVAGIRNRGMSFERELCARIADDVATDYLTADAPSGVRAAMEIARLVRERV